MAVFFADTYVRPESARNLSCFVLFSVRMLYVYTHHLLRLSLGGGAFAGVCHALLALSLSEALEQEENNPDDVM